MFITVATQSNLKIEAVKAVFKDATVTGVKTSSGVPEQPIEGETEIGARNRLRAAKESAPDADLYISIENGIFCEDGKYIDKAIVIIENNEGEQQLTYSSGVVFPEKFFLEAQNKSFHSTTVGQVMFEAGYVEKKDDPHASLGDKTSRIVLLTQAITEALERLNQTHRAMMSRP